MKSNWNYPTTVWAGEGRSADLPEACLLANIKNPLFVTDKDLITLPMTIKTIDSLKKVFKDINIFSKFSGNPVGKNIMEGVEFYNKNKCDGVIAFGGGSALDVGKGIAFMCGQTRPLWDFEDVGNYWKRADESKIAPIIAIPTTAGTGSETGRASAIVNEETGVKKIIFHPKFMPTVVILDPLLTIDLPPRITAATGMDALAHNLEAYCAPNFHPMAEGIALEGIRLIDKWLLIAVKDGNNIEARMNMLVSASMGSTAFQKGLGAIHSLSHPVNALNNIQHGLSNAIFMPYVLTFNKDVIEKKIIKISKYLSLKDITFNSFIEWVLKFRKDLDIPHKLSDVIKEEDFDLDRLSKMALEDPSTAGNPKTLSIDDMKIMYQHSMSGKLF